VIVAWAESFVTHNPTSQWQSGKLVTGNTTKENNVPQRTSGSLAGAKGGHFMSPKPAQNT